MGGGGLRILGHKRWHVWRRENIERVERDERAQEQQTRDHAAQRRRVEQEWRVEALLKKAGSEEGSRGRPREGSNDGEKEHVNLFRKEEQAHVEALARGDRAAKRTSHPPNETLGSQGRVPWYAQSSAAMEKTTERNEFAEHKRERKRRRELALADPLQHMRPARRDSGSEDEEANGGGDGEKNWKRRRLSGSDRRRYSSRYAVAQSEVSSESEDDSVSSTSSSDSERESKHRRSSKRKSSKAKREKKKKKKTDRKKSKRESMMDKLRRERDAREEKERRRADKLLSGR